MSTMSMMSELPISIHLMASDLWVTTAAAFTLFSPKSQDEYLEARTPGTAPLPHCPSLGLCHAELSRWTDGQKSGT